jgi:hypothetical protein
MPGVPCHLYMCALAAATMPDLPLNFSVNIQEQQDVHTTPGSAGYVGCGT